MFSIIYEFDGSTFVSQHMATNCKDAVSLWVEALHELENDGITPQIARAALELSTPVPVAGLSGVWCDSAVVHDKLVLIHIVDTCIVND